MTPTHERIDSRHCSCGYGFASESHLTVHLDAQDTVTPTHEQVLATIDKARLHPDWPSRWHDERDAHCDDLRATAERHAPHPLHEIPDQPGQYYGCTACHCGNEVCPDYQQVVDRLTGWGML